VGGSAAKYYLEDGAGNIVSREFSEQEIAGGADITWLDNNSPEGIYYLHKCEYTGFKDMKGKFIYCNDILVHREMSTLAGIWEVFSHQKKWKRVFRLRSLMMTWLDYTITLKRNAPNCEVVGNTYDCNRAYLRKNRLPCKVVNRSGKANLADLRSGQILHFRAK